MVVKGEWWVRDGLGFGDKQMQTVIYRMDKEDVVHIYSRILLSHKKEQNWVICRDVDESRDCHTE